MNGYDITFELAYRAILAQARTEERNKNEHNTDDSTLCDVVRDRDISRQKLNKE